jgi:hypothetical protein
MNDPELTRLLRSAKVPPPPPDYWEEFPGRVMRGLLRPVRDERPRRPWIPRLAWGLSFAAICLLVGFFVGRQNGSPGLASKGLLRNEALIRETLSMFPNRVRAIVEDADGLSLVLSDSADVPVSEPLWLKIRSGGGTETLVTFSGQEITVAGRRLTVLSDAQGGVLLVGDRFYWTTADSGSAGADLRIQAEVLSYRL